MLLLLESSSRALIKQNFLETVWADSVVTVQVVFQSVNEIRQLFPATQGLLKQLSIYKSKSQIIEIFYLVKKRNRVLPARLEKITPVVKAQSSSINFN